MSRGALPVPRWPTGGRRHSPWCRPATPQQPLELPPGVLRPGLRRHHRHGHDLLPSGHLWPAHPAPAGHRHSGSNSWLRSHRPLRPPRGDRSQMAGAPEAEARGAAWGGGPAAHPRTPGRSPLSRHPSRRPAAHSSGWCPGRAGARHNHGWPAPSCSRGQSERRPSTSSAHARPQTWPPRPGRRAVGGLAPPCCLTCRDPHFHTLKPDPGPRDGTASETELVRTRHGGVPQPPTGTL